MSETITQKLLKTTLERLRDHGRGGESFDKTVRNLLDEVERK